MYTTMPWKSIGLQTRARELPVGSVLILPVVAILDASPPRLVLLIPANRLKKPGLEGVARRPMQLPFELTGIDRVSPIVPQPVRHMSDQRIRLVEGPEDQTGEIDIGPLAVAADVVTLTLPSPLEDQRQRFTVILHVKPVADVEPVAVQRERFVGERIGDKQRDDLLRELVGAIVVATACDDHRQPVGVNVRIGQEIRRRLAVRVRTVRGKGALFREAPARSK